jgi:hypothetical protein
VSWTDLYDAYNFKTAFLFIWTLFNKEHYLATPYIYLKHPVSSPILLTTQFKIYDSFAEEEYDKKLDNRTLT